MSIDGHFDDSLLCCFCSRLSSPKQSGLSLNSCCACCVQKLKEDKKVWCIHNTQEKDDVLFPQDPKPLISLNQDLVDFWHSTQVWRLLILDG